MDRSPLTRWSWSAALTLFALGAASWLTPQVTGQVTGQSRGQAAPAPQTGAAQNPAGRGGGRGGQGRGGRGGNNPAAPPADAVVAPNGQRCAWVAEEGAEAGRNVWSSTRAAADAPWSEPNRLLTIRGTVDDPVFSPDSTRIAFANPRSTNGTAATDRWGFIVVYDIASRQLHYIDPSFDIDSKPSWSADGRQISFTRSAAGAPDQHLSRPVPAVTNGAAAPAAWLAPPAAGESFTMASVLAASFLEPPVPARNGSALAYFSREGAERNIYEMSIDGRTRLVVTYPGDDGEELSELTVSNGGGAVAYVRSVGPNGQGDDPNPNHLPDPPHQQVWIVGTESDAPHLLGDGNAPQFSPDGSAILWSQQGRLMGANLIWSPALPPDGNPSSDAGSRLLSVSAPFEYFAGNLQGMRYSPDGRRIAYNRGGGIEIYDLASKMAVDIPHPGASDTGAVWSPDSTRVAFRRQVQAPSAAGGRGGRGGGGGIFGSGNCGNYRYCGPERSDRPWAIAVASVSDLQSHQIWQASTGVGSVYYSLDQALSPAAGGDQMFWSANDQIAFIWEHDGWRHFYAVPAAGGEAKLLTPGEGEIEAASISHDRKQLIYATNIGDLGRRHIAAVGFDGAAPRNLTSGDDSQWGPTPLAGGRVGFINGGWSMPPRVEIRDAAGAVKTASLPRPGANFPSSKLVKPQLVEFPASDGQTAYGYLLVPAAPKGCAVIFSHGGIRRQMLPGFHYMDAYFYLYGMNQYLASRGCVVLSVEYRSSIMRGEAFRNAPGWGFAGNSELLDFVGAAKYLAVRKDVDAKRIGIYGLSWGGYMTANALSQHSDLFSAGFDMAGVHNSSNEAGQPYSAIMHLDTWKSPVFLAQGDDDRNVTFTEGITLARKMQAQYPNIELKTRVLPGEVHDMSLTFDDMVSLYSEGAEYLLQHLANK